MRKMNCCCFSLTFVHLQAIFDWNVKQLFLYLSAEYTTKTNVSYLKQKHMPSHQYTSVSLFFLSQILTQSNADVAKMPISKPKHELSSYGMLLAYWYKPLIIYMCYICVHTHTQNKCVYFFEILHEFRTMFALIENVSLFIYYIVPAQNILQVVT